MTRPAAQPPGEDVVLRPRLLVAPWWVLSLLAGTWFTAVLWLWRLVRADDQSQPLERLIGAAIAGTVYSLLVGPFLHRQQQKARAAAGQVSPAELAAAAKALRRGPVPADPRVRDAAARLATHRLQQLDRHYTLSMTAGLLLLAAGTIAVATGSLPGSWLLLAALTAYGTALLWSSGEPRRLRRRLTHLQTHQHCDLPQR